VRKSVEIILDVMLLVLMLAVGVQSTMFCVNVFTGGVDFGFGTLGDKSLMMTTAQTRSLGLGENLKEKTFLTKAHLLMLPIVDDEVNDSVNRSPSLWAVTTSASAPAFVPAPAGKLFSTSYPIDIYKWSHISAIMSGQYSNINSWSPDGVPALGWNAPVLHLYLEEVSGFRLSTIRTSHRDRATAQRVGVDRQ